MKKIITLLITAFAISAMTGCIIDDGHHRSGHGGYRGHDSHNDHDNGRGGHHNRGWHRDRSDRHNH